MLKKIKDLTQEETNKICDEFCTKNECEKCPLHFKKGCIKLMIPDFNKINEFVCREIDPENIKCELSLKEKIKEALKDNTKLSLQELDNKVDDIIKLIEEDKNGK